ncbi:DUF4384 domain-containing protein [Anaeromyxobacter diazotrophicus]|uniref:Zinc-finger domain-containing protein n=1 Tax=Anaeromyxobacter diazotrophicus TaxID=2590199 RepID=A0A7I9VJV8_9BACT|nr:DUF4384 domain-containing protein [Anaeromyxobacter diazotrophicus]GEJ56469.1 hypothetical protein AMYX_12100 [Anaeromyxobacter diazotrophicus]
MSRCPSELELEQHLLGPDAEVEAHLAGCPRCRARLAELEQEGETFRREVFPATVAAVVERSRPRAVARPGRWRLLVAPLAAAAAAAVFLWARPPRDYVGAKGGALELAVWVQTPGGARAAQDGAAVPAAADVRFQVRPPRACRLWLVSVDAAGQVSCLFPAGGGAAAELRAPATLPGGAHLDGRGGPERLYAVCSPRPLPYGEVERAVLAAAGGGEAAVRAAGALPGLPEETAQATLLLEKRP